MRVPHKPGKQQHRRGQQDEETEVAEEEGAESSTGTQRTGEESGSGRRGCFAQTKCGKDREVPEDFSNLGFTGGPGDIG